MDLDPHLGQVYHWQVTEPIFWVWLKVFGFFCETKILIETAWPVNWVAQLKQNTANKIAFIGDGINDAPVLATSDVGIAMGGLGSDVAIETADVIIQTDQPSKVIKAIKIGRSTRQIVWQNIAFAFGVKLAVMILGTLGLATMWEAVFADVGVALLAILNAVRLQKIQYN